MIRAPFASALALAALLAVPAFAQTDSNSPSVNGANVAPLEKNAAKQSAAAPAKQSRADSTTSSTTSASADVNSRSVDGANVAPLEKNSSKQSASSGKQAKADKTASSTSAHAVDCNSKMVDGANVAPLEKNSAKQQATTDGKLADGSKSVDCVSDKTAAKPKKKTTTASNTPK